MDKMTTGAFNQKRLNKISSNLRTRAQTAAKMMQCFHFIVEPAKNLTAKIKESNKRGKKEKKELLDEDQLFIVELAKDLNRVCQEIDTLQPLISVPVPAEEKRSHFMMLQPPCFLLGMVF
ncbi:hypothetical protein AMECASPLE_011474 [Ameca splendens]|uniref:Uncharacterized protein n=1 Tax=Ameca splendens TaxID=208324 RepID=A0ABV0XDV2_9TELE